ncbi:hypothetical protein [Nitrospirillum sp. BR 11828]|uniref:hypothetical protein n=1 Tax=Nitrospirillum sp. BR 11828 TaxID=3104325 RepID=UPI002ACB0433|nr:hypothetical protein [Nitrospirillum sp. BR 11828]MDZ5645688.1 hypothetical protein [Nitrospirillum sp. BR 11828]
MRMNQTKMAVALVVVCGVAGLGVAFMRSPSSPSAAQSAAQSAEVAGFRAAMTANFAEHCFQAARASSPAGVADAKLHRFCDCTATRVNAALTDKEVTVLAEQERKGLTGAPALLMDKAKPIAAACRGEAGLTG